MRMKYFKTFEVKRAAPWFSWRATIVCRKFLRTGRAVDALPLPS
jgi:hypothetical protein